LWWCMTVIPAIQETKVGGSLYEAGCLLRFNHFLE
jgi:hypothetical protein